MIGYTRLKLGEKLKLENVNAFYCGEYDFFFDEYTNSMYDKYTGVIIHRDSYINCKNYLRYRLQKQEYMEKLENFWKEAGSIDEYEKEGRILKKLIKVFENKAKIKLEIVEDRNTFFNARIVTIPQFLNRELSLFWDEIETRINRQNSFQWVFLKDERRFEKDRKKRAKTI